MAAERRLRAFADRYLEGNTSEEKLFCYIEGLDPSIAVSLAFVLLTGRYPSRVEQEVEEGCYERGDRREWLRRIATIPGNPTSLVFPGSGIYVDVTHTFVYQWLSGIQRVVRETAAALVQRHGARLYRCEDGLGPVLLTQEETESFVGWDQNSLKASAVQKYVLTWTGRLRRAARAVTPPLAVAWARSAKAAAARLRKMRYGPRAEVAWLGGCKIVLLELLDSNRSDIYFSFTRCADRTLAVFHDLIPVSHPHYCSPAVVGCSVEYLGVLAHFDRIVPVSESSGSAIREFFAMIGRDLPVHPRLLPDFSAPSVGGGEFDSEEPLLLYLSTLDPRKNHWRLLEACEELWKEGEKFRLRLIGSPGWRNEVILRKINYLQQHGMPLDYTTDFLTDEEVLGFLKSAYFTVLCSEVEGYGLPIAESLSAGVPVICSDVGSMREIADKVGGCVKIDPFRVESIRDGIRECLHDREQRERLRSEIDISQLGDTAEYADHLAGLVSSGESSH